MSRLSFLPTRMQPAAGRAASRVYNAARTMKGVVRPDFGSPAVKWTTSSIRSTSRPSRSSSWNLQLPLVAAHGRCASTSSTSGIRCRSSGQRLAGEHYRSLAGLAAELKPSLVVEVGTATGASALSISAVVSLPTP